MNQPADWKVLPLSEVVAIQRGFDLPHHARRPGPYPVLTSGDTGGFHDEGPITGPGVTIGRATNLGRPKWSEGSFWPHNTTMFVKDFMGHNPRWVFHVFENTDLAGYDSGSVQPMLNRNYIAQVPILVPPVSEQQAIAEVLGALDDKISANTKLATLAVNLLEAEFQQLDVDSPNESDNIALSELIEVNPKVTRPSESEPIYVDMQKLPTSTMTISGWENRPAKGGARFLNGDTLLARITPCLENRKTGFVDFLGDDQVGMGSTEFIVLRSRPHLPKALSYFIATNSRFRAFAIRHMVGTSGRQRVSGSNLEEYTLAKPKMGELNRFGEISETHLKLVKSLTDQNRSLIATRGALLPHLMSGRLPVKMAENLAAAV